IHEAAARGHAEDDSREDGPAAGAGGGALVRAALVRHVEVADAAAVVADDRRQDSGGQQRRERRERQRRHACSFTSQRAVSARPCSIVKDGRQPSARSGSTSTRSEPMAFSSAAPLPSALAPRRSSAGGTGRRRADFPRAWAMRRISSGVETSSKSLTKNGCPAAASF